MAKQCTSKSNPAVNQNALFIVICMNIQLNVIVMCHFYPLVFCFVDYCALLLLLFLSAIQNEEKGKKTFHRFKKFDAEQRTRHNGGNIDLIC